MRLNSSPSVMMSVAAVYAAAMQSAMDAQKQQHEHLIRHHAALERLVAPLARHTSVAPEAQAMLTGVRARLADLRTTEESRAATARALVAAEEELAAERAQHAETTAALRADHARRLQKVKSAQKRERKRRAADARKGAARDAELLRVHAAADGVLRVGRRLSVLLREREDELAVMRLELERRRTDNLALRALHGEATAMST